MHIKDILWVFVFGLTCLPEGVVVMCINYPTTKYKVRKSQGVTFIFKSNPFNDICSVFTLKLLLLDALFDALFLCCGFSPEQYDLYFLECS